jgi:acyl-CoA reductase-like NAD-dependent aldehyde dehydrogenase
MADLSTLSGTSPLSEMLQECRRRQRLWSGLPIRQRLEPVRALRRLLVEECDPLCKVVACDVGKRAEEVIGTEILPLAEACRFLERQASRLLRPRRVPVGQRPFWLWGQRDTIHRRPRGVVGIIGTWNYPLLLSGVQIVQALTAGNGVLWKPSEVAPESAATLFALLQCAGYPEGLLARLPATREAGQQLAEADLDHVVFTGSAAVGRELAAQLGRRLISSTLELSGCDAQFVLDDADFSLAARAAWFGGTSNRGQTCIAVRRVFVQRPAYETFLHALQPLAESSPAVPLALPSQVTQAERLVRTALADGARLLTQRAEAPAGQDTAFMPAVVVDARPEMEICREASFAPILAVLPCDTIEDALRGEESCSYALGASVFTNNPSRATPLVDRLRAGMVAINDVIAPTAHPATPFGGRAASGWGVTQGAEGLLEMTVPQVVSVRTDRFRPHYDLALGSKGSQENLLRGLLDLGHAPTWRRRGRGLRRVWRALLRRDDNGPVQSP